MLKLETHTIQAFPFELYAECNASQLEDLAKYHYITSMNSWMLPQIAHYYGTWDLVHDSSGKIDPKLTAKKNIKTPWEIGLWRVCTQLKRGSLVKSQINPEFASYSSLVPLILMGVKKYRGIMYSQWDLGPDNFLIDKNLREAINWQPDINTLETWDNLADGEVQYGLTAERLLELRDIGLTVKSGPKRGTKHKPTSSWCLRGMQNTELERAPKLVGTMLTQIWVAHPSLRTEYMILDPNAPDWMPPPLVADNIFAEAPQPQREVPTDLPWLV